MQFRSYFFLLVVLALTGLSIWAFQSTKFNRGLDIQGGIRLVYQMRTAELSAEQKQRLPEVRSNLHQILTNRVSAALGVVEGNVQQQGSDRFIVELPEFKDANKAREMLSSTAKIQAYWARNVDTELATYRPFSPVPDSGDKEGRAEVRFVEDANPTIELKPADAKYKEMLAGWQLILEGDDLANAFPQQMGNLTVPSFEFSSNGAKKLRAWSQQVMNKRENLAFVLDGRVLSIAPLKDNMVLSTDAFIEGDFNPAYVKELCDLLKAGSLPVALDELSSQTVDPTIGKAALNQMLLAGYISFGFICLFLIAYYLVPGLVALVALALYVLFTITVLKLIGATFSLAAIAGFILSVGMAVDANILVFERVKEEMRDGRTLAAAIELGFRRALPAIVDSNMCTILTSMVLVNLGTGPVKGFATTLIIGVAISLFTAVTVTRSLLVFLVGAGIVKSTHLFAVDRNWFGEGFEKKAEESPLQIVNTAKRWFLISLATIIPGAIFLGLGGLKPSVEFQGGIEAVYGMAAGSTTSPSEIVKKLEAAGIKGGNVKFASAEGQRLAYVTVPASGEMKVGNQQARERLATAAGFNISDQRSFTEVGPTIQKETVRGAILGVVISSALIVFYLALRFGLALGSFASGLKFGLSAILALVHDVLLVLGVAAIVGYFLGWELSALFLTAMLTVIGFSVHDTIVIFDRIRENLRNPKPGEDFANLCNRSISQSLGRSINTSMTVIVTLIIMIWLGTATPDLKFFCVAMLVGIISGTYSSIYNASPILYLWDKAASKKGEQHSLIDIAVHEAHARLKAQTAQMQTVPEGAEIRKTYSQVKRRSSAIEKSKSSLDD
ncbi:MAG: Protein translocase subunit SecDF [Fimbriimonadaceae bacterium]|nr:Protein translocase subunit SecDF [Fimbriimonadaceae bacterium]